MHEPSRTLRPHDVAVALQLVLTPDAPFTALQEQTGLSLGEVHNAVRRLQHARLVSGASRRAVIPALMEFLSAGVPYAFAGALGPEAPGVPTAHSAPPLSRSFRSAQKVVWPSGDGTARGHSLTPLLPAAATLPGRNPKLYRLLALVDALRVGRARERAIAQELLANALRTGEV
jgi:hypothetical protein